MRLTKKIFGVLLMMLFALQGCQEQRKDEGETASAAQAETEEENKMYQELQSYIEEAKSGFEAIPEERKELLKEASAYIRQQKEAGEKANLTFICTHNSRRSHLSQIWAATGAAEYGLANHVATYSGGTEATAFNPRAVKAIEEAGFKVEKPEGENPAYAVSYSESAPEMICYSKKYDAPENPSASFAAIMTCSQADENCPIIPGAEKRIPVTYEDPKAFDGTEKEAEAYRERCLQIATEMLYMMSEV